MVPLRAPRRVAPWTTAMVLLAATLVPGCSLLLETGGLSGARPAAPVPSSDAGPEASAGDAGEAVDASDAGDARSDLYAAAILADKPTVYLRFDEAAGAVAVRNAVDGAVFPVEGTIAFGAPGALGTAAHFDGSQRVALGDILDFAGTYGATIELWLKAEAVADRNEIVRKRGGEPFNGYILYTSTDSPDSAPAINFQFWGPAESSAWREPPLPTGLVHVVATSTNAKGQSNAFLYVNGARSPFGGFDQAAGAQPDTPYPLLVGDGLHATIDELAIYDRVLPLERILEHLRIAKE